jgi:8-oxo-dGTP pyrophosphatase MutT (NUDIX family)
MPIPEFVVDLRRAVGQSLLWLPGVTAVVVRDAQVLLVQRSDNRAWTPVTGIVDPGEHPAVAATREVLEETGVEVVVRRLASVSVTAPVTHVNGDLSQYLDHTFRCDHVAGEPFAADDESLDARWCPLDDLPPMAPDMLARIEDALGEETGTRLR